MLLPAYGTKTNRWIYPLIFIAVSLIGIAAALYVARSVYNANRLYLVERAGTLAEAIDPAFIKGLAGDESDLENPQYQYLKDRLVAIRSVNRDVRFIYLTGLDENGTMFFFADSEDPDSEDYSPPGQMYEEASPFMFDVFDGETRFEGSRDRWGYWYSAYAPIRDRETGGIVALVGLDVPGESYILNIATAAALPLLVAFIILLMISASQIVRKREQRAIDEKAEFLSIASHEIRTPLTGIRWAAENLLSKKGQKLDDYTEKIITLMQGNSVTLLARLNNLLDITALESGRKIALSLEPFSLREMIGEIASGLILSAGMRDIALRIDDSVAAAVRVTGDQGKLRQVFANLISNAIKYTKPETTVTVSYKRAGGMHVISIADQGEGIPAEEIPKIFEGYHRTKSAAHSKQYGTGIGLYLAKNIAELHGGRIDVVSKKGEGSVFRVVLPVREG